MSVNTTKLSSSFTKPIAIPATGADKGTPASIIDKLDPQTDAIELEPLDSIISETTLIVYGKSSTLGTTACTPLFASLP